MPPEESWETETLPARLKELCVAGGGGGGARWGYIFAGMVPLASQNAHLISVYSVAK